LLQDNENLMLPASRYRALNSKTGDISFTDVRCTSVHITHTHTHTAMLAIVGLTFSFRPDRIAPLGLVTSIRERPYGSPINADQ